MANARSRPTTTSQATSKATRKATRKAKQKAKRKPATVAEYLAAQPEPVRKQLARVRAVIRKTAPEAEELISYGIAGYKLRGRVLIYFAGWKQHFAVYP